MTNNDDKSKNKQPVPPSELNAMHSLAVGYGQYVSYLKSGGTSGISEVFGKVSLQADGKKLVTAGHRLTELRRQLKEQENKKNDDAAEPAPVTTGSVTVEDKLGAVFGIFSGALSVQDVCQTYQVPEPAVRRWLEIACRGMEAALKEDRS